MTIRHIVGLLGICLAPCGAYTAVGRFGHSAVLVNDSIYFYGGDSSITSSKSTPLWISDMAILPINMPFPLTDPPWRASSGPQSAVGGPVVYAHTAFVGGPDGTNMTLVGGLMPATEKQTSDDQTIVYSYDCQAGKWSSVSLPSNNFLSRQGAASSVTSDGIAHIWGGKRASSGNSSSSTTGYKPQLPASMYRLDTLDPSNSSLTPVTSPSPPLRYAHTQTLIRDRKIVILGGFDGLTGQALSMADIWVFDTIDQEWTHITATLDKDNKPANRSSHSEVLMPDGQSILIYGGYDGYHVFNDVAVLDTNTWTWTIKNTNAAVQGRADHTATLVGTNMIVAFGFTGVSTALTVLSDIEVLDINRWSWTSTYSPSGDYIINGGSNVNIGDQGNSSHILPSTPSMAIVAGAVTGVLVVFVLIIIAVYMFNYHQKRRGSHSNDQQQQQQRRERPSEFPSEDEEEEGGAGEGGESPVKEIVRGPNMSLGRAPTRLHVVTHSPIPQPPLLLSPWKPPVRQSFPPASSEWVVRRAATAPHPYLRHTVSKPDEPSAIRLWVRRAATTPRTASNLKPDSSEDDESVFDQQQFILRNEDDNQPASSEQDDEIEQKENNFDQQQRQQQQRHCCDDRNDVDEERDKVTRATPEPTTAFGKVAPITRLPSKLRVHEVDHQSTISKHSSRNSA